MRPFYRYKTGERHFVYLDPEVTAPAMLSYSDATYGGGEWIDFGGWMTSPKPGAWAEITFQGDAVRIHAYRYDDAGMLDVFVDGTKVGQIDEYSPKREEHKTWNFAGFGPGEHKLRLEHVEGKAPESKGMFVNVAGFEVGG